MNPRFLSRFFFATDDAGGAAGGAGGQGSAGAQGGTDGGDKKTFTADDVNRIITERERRFEARLTKILDERDAKRAEEKAKRKEERAVAEAAGATGEGKQPAPARDDAAMARVKALEAQLAEQKKQAELEKQQRLEQERDARVTAALAGAGAVNTRAALLLLKDSKRVTRNANGELVFAQQKEGYVDEVALDEGLKGWLATDEGKFFLPPTGAAGSGGSGGPPPNTGGRKMSVAEKKQEAGAALLNMVLQRPIS